MSQASNSSFTTSQESNSDMDIETGNKKPKRQRKPLTQEQKDKYAQAQRLKRQSLSQEQKQEALHQRRMDYASLSAEAKATILAQKHLDYASLSDEEKAALLAQNQHKYTSLSDEAKATLLAQNQRNYASLSDEAKATLLAQNQRNYASLSDEAKATLLAQNQRNYASLSDEAKATLLAKNQRKYASLSDEAKATLLAQNQRNYASLSDEAKATLLAVNQNYKKQKRASQTQQDKEKEAKRKRIATLTPSVRITNSSQDSLRSLSEEQIALNPTQSIEDQPLPNEHQPSSNIHQHIPNVNKPLARASQPLPNQYQPQPQPNEDQPLQNSSQSSSNEDQLLPIAAQTTSNEDQALPNAAQTTSNEDQALPNAAQTTSNEDQPLPDVAQTTSNEDQPLPDVAQSTSNEDQPLPNAAQSTSNEDQALPNAAQSAAGQSSSPNAPPGIQQPRYNLRNRRPPAASSTIPVGNPRRPPTTPTIPQQPLPRNTPAQIELHNANATLAHYQIFNSNLTHSIAGAAVLPINEANFPQHNAGKMDLICPRCYAMHFYGEMTTRKVYTNCCHLGKITSAQVPPFLDYPELLKNLISVPTTPGYKKFKDNIRSYNSSLAFASMYARIETPPGNGPYCFRAHGSVYHTTALNLEAVQGEIPKYNQLYVYDPSEALNYRLLGPQNNGCDREILHKLDQLIRQINPIARQLKMMYEVENDQRENNNPGIENPRLDIHTENNPNGHPGRFNLPTTDEVAMLFMNPDGEPPFIRDLKTYSRNDRTQLIRMTPRDPRLTAYVYPVFFPRGQNGWHTQIIQAGVRDINDYRKRHNVTLTQFKLFQLQHRNRTFNPLHHGGKLFQQFCVDSSIAIESNNLNFIRMNQSKLRVELYRGLQEHLNNRATTENLLLGKKFILPSSFEGSPRNMRQRYEDAMAIVSKKGKPDLFITVTCNPAWPEITENLLPGQQASDRPDLVARVFAMKYKALEKDIMEHHVLGKVEAYVYSVEFQKRGLPHVHGLYILEQAYKPTDEAKIDALVSAEFPDRNTHPRLFEIVSRCMVHGPCNGTNARCTMETINGREVCSKKFPKPLTPTTIVDVNGFPLYKRAEIEPVQINRRFTDNRFIIPYNPYLTLKYNCHINVEVCSSLKSVKYIFKYIYKGYDSASVTLTGTLDHDEIKNHVDARYLSAPEAVWRIFGNSMHGRSHAIIQLQVHEPDAMSVIFNEDQTVEQLLENSPRGTNLTAFFKLNQESQAARDLLYAEIPTYFVYDKKDREWKPRQRGASKIISRIYTVSPRDQERYSLRVLLLHVRGPQSFEDLRTYNGTIHRTFTEAAKARNLLQDATIWRTTMRELVIHAMPNQIRDSFAYIIALNCPSNTLELWNEFHPHMIEDYIQRMPQNLAITLALLDIEKILKRHGKNCKSMTLPEPIQMEQPAEEVDIGEARREYDRKYSTLNEEQKLIVDTIIQCINNPDDSECKQFYIDGPGGSGKTYVYDTISLYCKSIGKTFLAHATSGLAATNLERGKTAHSGFKIPIPVTPESISSMRMTDPRARMIRESSITVIDEASALGKHPLSVIEKLCREIMSSNARPSTRPFGNILFVLGGDFRQTLPILPRASRAEIVANTIKNSPLWHHFRRLTLTTNMRAGGVNPFSAWLLDLGDGKLKPDIPAELNLPSDLVEIPQNFIVAGDLITSVYGTNIDPEQLDTLRESAILTRTNAEADKLNAQVLTLINGESREYLSADQIVSDDGRDAQRYPIEFVNQQTPSGMPPHRLILKKGAIVMLLRNIDEHLCNGTRFVVRGMFEHVLDLEILTGSRAGERIYLTRMEIEPSDTNLPFKFKRLQFPIRLAFAMTINKSQGQKFKNLGIYLGDAVFGHGQLYVAFSRAVDPKFVKVHIVPTSQQGQLIQNDGRYFTRNIVYQEVLEDVPELRDQDQWFEEFIRTYEDPTINDIFNEDPVFENINLDDLDEVETQHSIDPTPFEVEENQPTETNDLTNWFQGELILDPDCFCQAGRRRRNGVVRQNNQILEFCRCDHCLLNDYYPQQTFAVVGTKRIPECIHEDPPWIQE